MEKNKRNRGRSSYMQDEGRNQYPDRRYGIDDHSQRTNYDYENTQRNFGRRSNDHYGPDYGNEYGQDFNRSQQNRGSYDQTRWPNDNDYNNNRQYNEFDRYQDYDRGFNNTGGYGGSSDYDPSWRQSDRDQRMSRNNFSSSGNWPNYRGGQGYSNDYPQRSSGYGHMNRGYDDSEQRSQDRNWWNRSRDEVASWFGDDEAEHRRRMDEVQRSSHKGKGPKDYQRSESRIREDVSDRLSDDHDLDASDIEVKVNGSEVILSGTVEDREAKRRAEDIAESVSGVSNVQNQLKVGQSSTFNSSSSPSKEKSNSNTGNALKNEKLHHN